LVDLGKYEPNEVSQPYIQTIIHTHTPFLDGWKCFGEEEEEGGGVKLLPHRVRVRSYPNPS